VGAWVATVHIVVYCPECQSRYQLHADLAGRRMRCPNNACRAVFTVQEATGGPPRDPELGARAANALGELVVPLHGADGGTRHAAAPEPVEELDWRSAPPPVQAPSPTEAPTVALPALPDSSVLGEPAAPPPRRPPITKPRAPQVQRPAGVTDDEEPPRRGKWVLLALGILVVGLAVGGGWVVYDRVVQAEGNLRAEAEKDYRGGNFRGATQKYRTLSEQYGRSGRAAEDRFLAELSDAREILGRTPPEPAEALQRTDAFLDKFGRDPLFKDRREELGKSLLAFATELVDAAETAVRSPELDAVPGLVGDGRRAVTLVRRVPPRGADPDALDGRFAQVDREYVSRRERQKHVAEVVQLLQGAKPDLRAAETAARRYGVMDDPAVAAAFEKVRATVTGVPYEPLNQPPMPGGPPDGPPSLLLEPFGPSSPAPRASKPDVVLAVARGLLYALEGTSGQRLWAARVGLDAGDLPVRVPARGDEPELVLVAGTDPPGLTARDARTGRVRWHQPLDEPCLGRPVLAGERLFVATGGPAGLVYDFDPRSGLRRGRFTTHQQLAAGAAYDAAAGRLYVPAVGQYVYVFTYDTPAESAAGAPISAGPVPRCDGWLTTGHAPGALRGEPIVVSGEEGVQVPRYLVLGEADGLGAMRLRAFQLFDDRPTAAAAPAEVRLPGWSWFPPYHDPEKLALVTDAGALGLFGIRQAGTADPALFPLLGRDEKSQIPNPKSQIPNKEASSRVWDLGFGIWDFPQRPARAQLVHAEEYGFWVLAGNVLQHWRLGLHRREGLRLTPAWGPGVRLGAPLHAAQVSADRSTLYLVTQTDSPPAYRATAVDARTGRVRWQRPLGLTPQGDPVVLGGSVLVLDSAGGLYRFDPSRHPAEPPGTWQSAGVEVAPPVADLVGEPSLVLAADGSAAYAFLSRRAGASEYQLMVRRVAADGESKELPVALPAPLAGTPALGPGAAVLPLADGALCRVALDFDNPQRHLGPNWRALGANPALPGHVLHWRGDDYLVTDGRRGLRLLHWPSGTKFKLETEQAVELTRAPVGVPVRLPEANGAPTAAVADAGGTLTLIRGDVPKAVRTWQMGGAITAGPWAVGDRLAVVVDHHRLVWLDPEKDAKLWTATIPGDGVEAAPRLVDGRLVVADLAGRFVALDPATGRLRGDGYRHPAEAAPAAAPVPFGTGRLFAPLTDGTVLLLPLDDLDRPAAR
jgi:outer membrane protein assembly factor BamB